MEEGRGSRVVALAAVLAVAVAGCGGPCKRVRAEHAALVARTAPATSTPHARVTMPYAVVNRLLADALGDAPRSFDVPLGALDAPAAVTALVPPLHATPRAVTIAAAAPGRVRLEAVVDIADDTETIVTLRAVAEVAPQIEKRDGRTHVVVGFRADDLRSVTPTVPPEIEARIAERLRARVPEKLRGRAMNVAIDMATPVLVKQLGARGFDLLRATVLARLGEVTRIGVDLPEVPVASVTPRSTSDALALDVATTLPVRAGIGEAPELPAGAVGVQLAGSTAAELGNWGIASGHLPQHYTRGLRPAADGAYLPYFDWRPGDARPLAVHMFKLAGGCAHFVVGAQPHVEVAGDRLRGWLTGRELERADAPLAFELLAKLNELFESAVTKPESTRASTRLTVGGRAVTGRVVRAGVDQRELDVALELAIAR